ncbi:Group II intron-encoded protein LtrA [termite gut metagenome]|uniref:Group II intron-encoded protein LtrA n=1 Tax=termite gut metagenome TaxID=433724 RepID=A0A5J4S1A7_9ZZZZ
MKRCGYLIESVIAEDNLLDAFKAVMRGKKRSRTTCHYKKHRAEVLRRLAGEIEQDIYTPAGYREFTVNETGKERIIQSLNFRDRIAIHAIMNVLYGRIFKGMMIRDTYSSLPDRGIHDGLRRVRTALKDVPGTAYCLKFDLKKFYHSVDQQVLIGMLSAKIKDRRMLATLVRIIQSYPQNGLPIGYHSSQLLGNFYLHPLDNYVKTVLKVKYYFRYCDDIVILSSSKEEFHTLFQAIRNLTEETLHLSIKENYQIFPTDSRGIDFLGYVIRHDYVRLRKRIKQNVARRLHDIKSKKRRRAVIAAFWGWAKHANGTHLFYILTGMKNFKDLGVMYKPQDGKKRFDHPLTPLGNLQNCEITVLDFETEIKTKEGEGRYVVLFELNEVKGKFITNSEEMKSILDQVKTINELPFKTIIRRKIFGQNKSKYIFE